MTAGAFQRIKTLEASVAGLGGTSGVSSLGEGAPLWIYGHSYTQTPGVACTAGLEFFNKLKTRRGFSAATTYGVGSSRAIDVYQDVLNQNIKLASTGSTWDPARRGAVIWDCTINDAMNRIVNGGSATALTATMLKNWQDSVAATLAILTSASRVECESGTKAGTWNADATGGGYSGGAAAFGATNGNTLDVAVTVPASGSVWLILQALSTLAPAAFTVTEGATNYATVLASGQPTTQTYTNRGAGGSLQVYPILVKITATPGAHTFRITQTSTGNLVADCFLIPHASPPPIALLRDPAPIPGGSNPAASGGNRPTVVANLALLNAALTTAAAAYPSATVVDASLGSTDLQVADGLHPNDRGMRKIADALLNSAWLSSDPSSLYAAL